MGIKISEAIKMSENINRINSPNISELNFDKEEMQALRDACLPEYLHIIEYLEEKETENKFRNQVNFICTIAAAVFSLLSVIIALIPYFN